ncbi:hypothetical protein NMG60_11007040 [Bertholletia excelsa]
MKPRRRAWIFREYCLLSSSLGLSAFPCPYLVSLIGLRPVHRLPSSGLPPPLLTELWSPNPALQLETNLILVNFPQRL